uniref:Hydrogenase maturation protease n=1 Tax=Solibacter usitatus (strain Ellin6076) TaxID=234267 RepID=Q01R80_SOLUE
MTGITLLGMGNVLMGDDGFGPYVIALLRARYEFGANLEVLDIGTPGLDITPYLARPGRSVILIDTVRSDGPAGTLRRYTGPQIMGGRMQPRLSPHDPALAEALTMLEIEGTAPAEFLLLGAVPEKCAMGTGLSSAMQSAVEPMIASVLSALANRGVEIRERETPGAPDLWWEAPLLV